ncbi:hypothetical protein NDU88_004537 [Pleurodeles waltl]|uniref:Uncharacterized protein n=1 Tax=Pleurodeles waltl TaxID=8319 RepID=A0AAV7TUG2_PLEWA|nr:hypothetical protein NDU88_004537 [Pleurodeles waltl]
MPCGWNRGIGRVSCSPAGAAGPRGGAGLGCARVPRERRPGAAAARGGRAGGDGPWAHSGLEQNVGPGGVGGSSRAAEEAELRLGRTFRPMPRCNWAGGGPLGFGRRGLSPGGPRNRDRTTRGASPDGAEEVRTIASPWLGREPGAGAGGAGEW